MKKHISINASITQVCQQLHTQGFVSAYGGNVSVRAGSRIIITPTHFSLAEITEDDLVVIDLEGNKLFGVHPPSSETILHLSIYRNRPEINGIVHTHPPICTSFAHVGRKIIPINPEAKEYLREVPIVPFHPVGSTELAEAVAATMTTGCNVAMLENHGLVSVGDNIYQAYNLTELAEETAQMNMYVHMLSLGQ